MSGVYHDSFEAIATRWTLAEVRDAHMILDALDAARPEG